ncbi:hypothetical protein HYG81_21560 (plasmid) [Natrinema zhouii]|uniref:hypothetical protein n=1 Tax=Natrinema zhouii TaxID=1710539 RepID=UPI001CFFEFFF|nr:hypothetical protein [Natrinema zhouii]UHQ98161.1 hypothetical protein HYG81_21560 [Natrinema zhouii]
MFAITDDSSHGRPDRIDVVDNLPIRVTDVSQFDDPNGNSELLSKNKCLAVVECETEWQSTLVDPDLEAPIYLLPARSISFSPPKSSLAAIAGSIAR